MRRSRARKFVVVALLTGLLAVGWVFVYEPFRERVEWSRRVRTEVYSLRSKRPPSVPRGQWEFAVGWTINLHANCSTPDTFTDPGWRGTFEAELKRRLQGQITLADIEWIWDEYAKHTKYGQKYSDNYRPTRDPNFSDASVGCFNMPVE